MIEVSDKAWKHLEPTQEGFLRFVFLSIMATVSLLKDLGPVGNLDL